MALLHPHNLHGYQRRAIWFGADKDHVMYHIDPGLGKTVISLTLQQMEIDLGIHEGALVVAPLTPAETVWHQEARRWSHTQGMRINLVLGDKDQRMNALHRPGDLWVINYENLQWLTVELKHWFLSRGLHLPFQTIIWDEVTYMRDMESKRAEAMLEILPYIRRRIGLTGTPSADNLEALHGQYLMVDSGLRLGVDKSIFRQRFFHQAGPYNYEPDLDAIDHLSAVVGDITLEMREEDYLELPPVTTDDIYLDLPPKVARQYQQLEYTAFLELDSGVVMDLNNPASVVNKLLQIASGQVYTDPETRDKYEILHDVKLDALERLYRETGDEPLLVAYQFRSEADRILKRFPGAVNLSGATGRRKKEIIDQWVAGEIKLLVGHPASMGHGTDRLQYRGRHMVWYSLNWRNELFIQFYKRLVRQGQKRRVIMHRLLMKNTFDEVQLMRLDLKQKTQMDFRDAVQKYREDKYGVDTA